MDVENLNAFTINSLVGRPFPFSAEFFQENEFHRLSIFPIQISSISNIIEKFSFDFCVIFDVDHYGWFEEGTVTLTDVAEKQGVKFTNFDKEIIICEKREF